jgi:hypothetical protein
MKAIAIGILAGVLLLGIAIGSGVQTFRLKRRFRAAKVSDPSAT